MRALPLLLALVLAVPVAGQPLRPAVLSAERGAEACAHARLARATAPQAAHRASGASHAFDATYYHLRIDVDFDQQRITGTTRAEGTLTGPLRLLRLDFAGNMAVSAVREGGVALAFSRIGDVLEIDLGAERPAGARVGVEVDYAGRPQQSGFGAFAFSSTGGRPVAWTLSEPYGARAWWPGKDHPSDKADSARVTVTVPEGLRVGSNGLLVAEATAGGRTTFDWAVRYPIAPYLLSLAAGPYAAFDQTYTRPDSLAAALGPLALPVLHYVYAPYGWANLPSGWAEVLDALAVFEGWFGPYPFAEEKYGHAEFGWGGGMEHQTMSSMGGSSVGLVTHELAHQWFGDAVTLRTWPHLWLNEGFASYAEILYWEAMADRYPGQAAATLQADQSFARNAQGTLVVEDTLNIGNLFAGSRVYAKGSAVLHMLRRVLGDAAFRETLQAYLTDPSLAYGTAVTDDLQRVAEAVSGLDLDAFFRQWVTEGTGYPVYAASYSAAPAGGGYDVSVRVRQTQTAPLSNVAVFEMPVTLAVSTAAGVRRFVVYNDERDQTFTLHVDAAPTGVTFDPDGDLLRNASVPVPVGTEEGPVAAALRLEAHPNPARGVLHVRYAAPASGEAVLGLYDALGRRVRTLAEGVAGPERALEVDLRGLPAGVYLLRLDAGEGVRVQSVTVLAR